MRVSYVFIAGLLIGCSIVPNEATDLYEENAAQATLGTTVKLDKNEHEEKQRIISGKALRVSGFVEIPMKHQGVVLMGHGKVIDKTKTNIEGEFVFKKELPPGEYRLKVDDPKTGQTLTFKLKDKNVTGLKVFVIDKPVQ